ncbi:MAG TPA: hypothetical protein VJG30_01940 [Candidatus Nanoarchaeia archaeon]|nr:hypothetical protein [Candidatus Nanoarchaeia archaeon]
MSLESIYYEKLFISKEENIEVIIQEADMKTSIYSGKILINSKNSTNTYGWTTRRTKNERGIKIRSTNEINGKFTDSTDENKVIEAIIRRAIVDYWKAIRSEEIQEFVRC